MGCSSSKQVGNTQASEVIKQEAVDLEEIHTEFPPRDLHDIPTYSADSGFFRLSPEGPGIKQSADELSQSDSWHSMAKGGSESQLAEQGMSCHEVRLKAFLESCSNEAGLLKKSVRA
eukprot:TRINITY_DN24101_c0_g1_i1.p1 TRINITY_DN24101_c0_g1~~TRINITY_DN24101_c0_g1_i1.p1  ORF type:complete len:117 (+),score=12.09 TRINITY_DN24101_c0_g1_i1:31-381(+)